jgi:hypothetical protein
MKRLGALLAVCALVVVVGCQDVEQEQNGTFADAFANNRHIEGATLSQQLGGHGALMPWGLAGIGTLGQTDTTDIWIIAPEPLMGRGRSISVKRMRKDAGSTLCTLHVSAYTCSGQCQDGASWQPVTLGPFRTPGIFMPSAGCMRPEDGALYCPLEPLQHVGSFTLPDGTAYYAVQLDASDYCSYYFEADYS